MLCTSICIHGFFCLKIKVIQNVNKVKIIYLSKKVLIYLMHFIFCLQDLKQLSLTDNPSYDKSGAEKGDAYIDMQDSKYICPVVGIEMNGRYR